MYAAINTCLSAAHQKASHVGSWSPHSWRFREHGHEVSAAMPVYVTDELTKVKPLENKSCCM